MLMVLRVDMEGIFGTRVITTSDNLDLEHWMEMVCTFTQTELEELVNSQMEYMLEQD
jgi:hypothetical protein